MRNQKAAKQPVADKPKKKRKPKGGATIPVEDVAMLITKALIDELEPLLGIEDRMVEAAQAGASSEQIFEDKKLLAEVARLEVECLYKGALYASLYPLMQALGSEMRTSEKGEFTPKAMYGLIRQAWATAGQLEKTNPTGTENYELLYCNALPVAEWLDSDTREREQQLSLKSEDEQEFTDKLFRKDALAFYGKLLRAQRNQARIYARLTEGFPKPEELENEIQQQNETT